MYVSEIPRNTQWDIFHIFTLRRSQALSNTTRNLHDARKGFWEGGTLWNAWQILSAVVAHCMSNAGINTTNPFSFDNRHTAFSN
jgi:hypothetical protein